MQQKKLVKNFDLMNQFGLSWAVLGVAIIASHRK